MSSKRIVVKGFVARRKVHVRQEGVPSQVAIWALNIVEIAGLVVMTEQSARAYVDPGSGFLAFQMAGASLAGAAFVLRRKLRRLFRRDRAELKAEEASPALVAPQASSGKQENQIVS